MFARVPVKAALAGTLVWLMVALAVAATIGCFNYVQLRNDFETEARTLHRIVSQRADQHDAHLTSLAAILSSPDLSISTLRAVSEAVLRFYPLSGQQGVEAQKRERARDTHRCDTGGLGSGWEAAHPEKARRGGPRSAQGCHASGLRHLASTPA